MNWRLSFISLSIASALALGLHALSKLNFWACLVIVVGAMLLNGYVATVEDEWPGSFNNPEPAPPSDLRRRVAKSTEWLLRAIVRPR